MKIAILTRLRRSRFLQACSRTASAWRLQFSGGCVEAVAHKRVLAPRLYGDCNSQAAASKPLLTSVFSHRVCMEIAIFGRPRRSRCLHACCRNASVKRLQFSGGCVESVVAPRLHGHFDSQAAASAPLLTSVLSHRVCMEIAILRRLRRSRCLQACCRIAAA